MGQYLTNRWSFLLENGFINVQDGYIEAWCCLFVTAVLRTVPTERWIW